VQSPGYQAAVTEIIRGIKLVSGLTAQAAHPGWVAVECGQASKARWLSDQIQQENVAAYSADSQLFLPVGEDFTLKGEIKNVITVVAKTTHYWSDHLATEVKNSLVWEERLQRFVAQLRRWLGRQ
jgi:hypothetical protein